MGIKFLEEQAAKAPKGTQLRTKFDEALEEINAMETQLEKLKAEADTKVEPEKKNTGKTSRTAA